MGNEWQSTKQGTHTHLWVKDFFLCGLCFSCHAINLFSSNVGTSCTPRVSFPSKVQYAACHHSQILYAHLYMFIYTCYTYMSIHTYTIHIYVVMGFSAVILGFNCTAWYYFQISPLQHMISGACFNMGTVLGWGISWETTTADQTSRIALSWLLAAPQTQHYLMEAFHTFGYDWSPCDICRHFWTKSSSWTGLGQVFVLLCLFPSKVIVLGQMLLILFQW